MGKVEENFRELTLMSGEFVLMFFFYFSGKNLTVTPVISVPADVTCR